MAKADMQLTLQGGRDRFDWRQYQPGETLQGVLTIVPDQDVRCQHVYVRLGWHTDGRGTRYDANVEELDLFQGTLTGGMPRVFEFSFTLPRDPWSFQGHYVSVVWDVLARIDVSWAKDPTQVTGFVLRPFPEQTFGLS